MFRFNPFKSMTIQGAVAAVAPYLVDAFNIGAVAPKTATAISLIGVLWATLGLRNAVEKAAGKAVVELTDKLITKASGR